MKLEVGSKIVLKEFTYNNKGGGTGLSTMDPVYPEEIECQIIKKWHDYETGIRGWAYPVKEDKKLLEFLKENSAEGKYDNNLEWQDNIGEFVIYWSEFDVLKVKK